MTQDIRPGRTCLLSSVSNGWRHAGRNVTEPALFLLGHGNRVQCRVERRHGMPLAFVGHHSAEILARFCEQRMVPHRLVRGRGELVELAGNLRRQLDAGNRPILWVEMARLPYIRLTVPPGAMHAVAVEDVSQGIITIADCYVTRGLYSQAVHTQRAQLPLEQFAAWEQTDYLRHEIDYHALDQGFALTSADVQAGLAAAALDFLGGVEMRGSAATLLRFADDLRELHATFDAEARRHLFGSLAYSLRYFGTLWSREFLSGLVRQHAPATLEADFCELADELSSCCTRWKNILFMALKLANDNEGARAVDGIHARFRSVVEHEVRVYGRLLELLPTGASAHVRRPGLLTDSVEVTRFGFDAGLENDDEKRSRAVGCV